MKLYIKAISSYRSDKEEINIKQELKKSYKIDVRRKDDFIYAGLYGALRLRDTIEIKRENELYLTSGYGNINILSKIYDDVEENKGTIKLFDFINMLGNTTSFYVATELGIKAKSIFQISDNFTYFNTLVSVYASLCKTKNEAIVGALDIASENEEVLKRVAGIEEQSSITTSVMFQKFSLDATDALCEVEFDTKFYTLEEIQKLLKETTLKTVFSTRCKELDAPKRAYIETDASSVINESITNKESCLYVECYEKRYKIIQVLNIEN
jgi:hypothetical protein